jgi:hypothetical protein
MQEIDLKKVCPRRVMDLETGSTVHDSVSQKPFSHGNMLLQ